MQQIFAFGPATGRYAMGSSDPLGTPKADYPDTQDSDTVMLGEDDHPTSPSVGASTEGPGAAADADKRRTLAT
jgi:hypothetical protein